MSWSLLIVTLVSLAATPAGMAEERFPPPEFTDHELPSTVVPPVPSAWYEYADLGFLVFGLSLASYLALRSRSRRGLFLLSIASLVWLGFWRTGCICPIGAIQDVALACGDPTYSIPLVVVVLFTLPLVFTLFFGRTFCAAVCPLGAVQELVAVRPVKVPTWLDQTLGLLAYVYLGAAVLFAATGTAFVICRYDPFVGFFRRSGTVNMMVLGACFLAVGFFVGRPYCRYLCPYGAVLGWLSKAAKWHVRIPPTECIQCRLCEDACPYGAIHRPTVAQSPTQRSRARRHLVGALVALPLLVVLGSGLGVCLRVPLARVHPTVQLAERVFLEQSGRVEGTVDASDAFRNTGRAPGELYAEARQLRHDFGVAGAWFGAWVGLVIGVKLVHLSIRRRRTDYEPDRTSCVSCGRCFWYCPAEQARLGFIQDAVVPAVEPERELVGSASRGDS